MLFVTNVIKFSCNVLLGIPSNMFPAILPKSLGQELIYEYVLETYVRISEQVPIESFKEKKLHEKKKWNGFQIFFRN